MFEVFETPEAQAGDLTVTVIIYLVVAIALMAVLPRRRNAKETTVRLLQFYLVYNLFELAIKRLTHFSWYIYPLKTALLVAVLLAWLLVWRERQPGDERAPHGMLLKLYLALAAVQVFNPSLSDPLVGLMGWYNDFIFALFYFVAFDLMDSWSRVRRFVVLTAVLGVVSALGAFIEQMVGPDVLLHAYPAFVQFLDWDQLGRVVVRPTSLSVYMEVFGIAAMVILLAFARDVPQRLLLICGMLACGIANVLHGVRIAWLTIVLFMAIFTLLNWRRSVGYGLLFLVCVGASAQVALALSEGAIAVRLETLETPIDTFSDKRLGGLTALPEVVAMYPYGIGPGRTSPGLRFLDQGSVYATLGTHNYLTDLAGQLSLLGPLLLLAYAGAILWTGIVGFFHLRSEQLATVAAGAFAVFASMTASFFAGGAMGAYPVNEYFWLMAGLLMRSMSPALQQSIVEQRGAARAAPRVVPVR